MTIKLCMVPEIWSVMDTIFCLLRPFFALYPLNNPKNQSFEKLKKIPGDIIILHKCTKNHDHMLYCSLDMAHNICNCYFSFWATFCLFTSLTAQKIKIKKKNFKKCLEISSFYIMCTKNYDQMMYGSWDMVRDRRTDGQMEKVTDRGGCPT